jgi:hypothetical protein
MPHIYQAPLVLLLQLFVVGPDAYGYYTTNRCTMTFAAGSSDDQLADSLDAIDPKEIDSTTSLIASTG